MCVASLPGVEDGPREPLASDSSPKSVDVRVPSD
jgi:hypothetical protein